MGMHSGLTRRKFLNGISIGAFIVASRPALAGLHLHGTSGATGKSVLNGFSNQTDFPFINLAQNISGQNLGGLSPTVLNSDGYPAGPTLTSTIGLTLPTPIAYVGSYLIKWTGTGGFGTPNTTNISSLSGVTGASTGANPGGFTVTGTNGRIVLTITTPALTFPIQLPSGSYSNMANLVICRLADEAAITAGAVFMPEFLSAITTLNPRIERPMGWALSGGTDINMSQYAYRCPTTALSYFTNKFPPACFVAAATGGTGAAYTCNDTSPSSLTAWTDGLMFQATFTLANTSTTPTIAPNGLAAKTIVDQSANTLSVGKISAGSIGTLVYDAILDQVIYQPGGIVAGPPVEIKVALCNALNKDYWHNFPFVYSDASITAETAYIAANLKSGLNACFELSNEMWNNALSWTVGLATKRGTALGFSASSSLDLYGGVGLRYRQVMGLVTTAWGGRGGLSRALAWQTVDGVLGTAVDTRLLQGGDLASVANGGAGNATWISKTGNANYRTVGQRPIDFCDALSYAPYYVAAQAPTFDATYVSFGSANIADLLTNADLYATGTGPNIATALAWFDGNTRLGTWPVKAIQSVSGTTINSMANGLSNGQAVVFQVSGGSLPSPLVINKIYYVVSAATNAFSVSATSGGAAISLSGGSGTWTVGRSVSGTMLDNDVGPGGGSGSVYTTWQATAANYSKFVVCYEGGFSSTYPTAATCTTMGISTTYGDAGGKIDNLIKGYKNNALGLAIARDQFKQFMGQDASSANFGLLAQSKYPAWLSLAAEDQWSLYQGDIFSTPFQTYFGVQTFNNS